MDNLHLLIVVTLLSFGTGHAIFRSKFGFLTLAFLSLFIYFIYSQIQGAQWSIIALSSFIAGIVYAYRESSEGMLDDWLYRAKEFLASVKSKLSIKRQAKQSHAGSHSYDQQAYEAEQARREQEAKAQREQHNNQNQQQEPQEKPKQERAKQQYQRQQRQKESIEKNKPVTDKRTNLEILGLSPGFTQAELKTAKKRVSQRVHRDKWPGRSEEFLQSMDEEQKMINKAYDELKSKF